MKRIFAATLLVIAGMAALALPASARLTMYADKNFGLEIGWRDQQGWWNMQSKHNDKLSSAKNYTRMHAAFWFDANMKGKCFPIYAGTEARSFWWFDDDQVSSYALGRAC